MSGENITILEGGKAENFGQVTKLRTSNGTDHDLWVPKGDVETKHLSVKKNGLYYTNQYEPTASEKKDGKAYDIYGWDTITVSVKKKVSGKKKKSKPDGTEIDVPTTVEVDDDGNLVEKELPTSIEIQIPPSKLDYLDGESISKNGMVVKAYYADDTEWGTVPLNEITLDPTTASGGGSGTGDIYTDGEGINAVKVTCSMRTLDSRNYDWKGDVPLFSDDGIITTYNAGYEGSSGTHDGVPTVYYVTRYKTSNYGWQAFVYMESGTHSALWRMAFSDFEYKPVTSSNKAVKGRWVGDLIDNEWLGNRILFDHIPESTVDPTTKGTFDPTVITDTQTITVKWTPDGGEDELTDTFDISVTPHN